MRIALLALLVVLAGCDWRDPDVAQADYKILCEPETGKAFYVRPGVADVSFVLATPSADKLCTKGSP